jgi:hypothetical protein
LLSLGIDGLSQAVHIESMSERFSGEQTQDPAMMLFAELQQFMELTRKITEEQLEWLSLAQDFMSNDVLLAYDELVSASIAENVTSAMSTMYTLSSQYGLRIFAPLENAKIVVGISGFAYDTDTNSYQAVICPQEDTPIRWSVKPNQLMLRATPTNPAK